MKHNFLLKAEILAAKAASLKAEINLLADEYEEAEESPAPLKGLRCAEILARNVETELKDAAEILWN